MMSFLFKNYILVVIHGCLIYKLLNIINEKNSKTYKRKSGLDDV